MRILYLTEFLSAIGGGGELVFRDFAVEMANRGHRVDLLCHESDEFWSCTNELVTIHKIPPTVILHHGYFPSFFQQASYVLKLVFKGAEIVKQNKIDIIHANTLSPAFAGAILGKLYNIPVINTIHHVHSLKKNEYTTRRQRRNKVIFKLSAFPKFLCEKIIVRLPTDGIHTVSQSSKDDLIRFGVKNDVKITIIPNAIQFPSHDDVEYGNFALFIGRLVDYKNLDVIITAFREVVDTLPDARLVVAGDGPEGKKWKEMVSSTGLASNIDFEGYVSEERKDELLRNCALLVFPSLIEGFGLVILEAFTRKKPVIVSDVKPFTEIIDDFVDGFRVSPTSPDDWAEKIILLLKNKSTCKAMGEEGRIKVEKRFNITIAAERLESFYKELIEKRYRRLEELEATI